MNWLIFQKRGLKGDLKVGLRKGVLLNEPDHNVTIWSQYQRPATNVGLPHLLVGHGVLPPVAAAAIVYVTNFEAFFEALDMDPDLLNTTVVLNGSDAWSCLMVV